LGIDFREKLPIKVIILMIVFSDRDDGYKIKKVKRKSLSKNMATTKS